jgi:hypothetical protein
LNKNAIKININPKFRNLSSDLTNKHDKSSNEVEPKDKYINEKPKRRKQEITAPKIKYFNPLSVANSDVRSKVAKIKKLKVINSNPK